MRRFLGLRPRLLIALLLTAALTLAVAALTLLTSLGGSPLQERLREESARSLFVTVQA